MRIPHKNIANTQNMPSSVAQSPSNTNSEYIPIPRNEREIEALINYLEEKIGIGSGADPAASGENRVFDLLRYTNAPLKTIFDVGANLGQYVRSIIAHIANRETYRIHCFEPGKDAFAKLHGSFANNECVVLNNFGLFSQPGSHSLYMDSQGSGLASLTQRRLEHFAINHGNHCETVELKTLNQYCKDHSIGAIDLLKVDVEGHEMDVFKGAEDYIDSVSLVQFEFGGCNIDTRTFFQDFYYFFTRHNFTLYRILPNGKFMGIRAYSETDEKFRCSNYLCINKSYSIPNHLHALFL